MQWHAILGLKSADDLRGSYSPNHGTGVRWAGWDPPTGAMTIDVLDALCRLLETHTADTTNCYFGLCTIRGWWDSAAPDVLPYLLELPSERNHVVLAGPLSSIDQIIPDWGPSTRISVSTGNSKFEYSQTLANVERVAPNLIWPADHSWFVASDVDFDSTLVGGSGQLIRSITDSPSLEAWQVQPTDSLADNADIINNPA